MLHARRLSVMTVLVGTAFALGCSRADAPVYGSGDLPSFKELGGRWHRLAPGGQTTCSDGSEYAFFVRPASAESLLVYFQGGGACWRGENCDRSRQLTYDPVVDEDDDPARWRAGIFDLENPENPFREYSMVFVPYCTGDVHLGNRVVTYDVPATDTSEPSQVTIRHKGYVNAMAVLEWVFANFDAPSTVFVSGSSAGSIPSPVYAGLIADRYRKARIASLADASGGYRGDSIRVTLDTWGTAEVLPEYREYRGVAADSLTFQLFFTATGKRHPDLTLTEFNTAGDAVQVFFLQLAGVEGPRLLDLIDSNQTDIRRAITNYRVFTAGGVDHTILASATFYSFQVDGRRFRDWVDALAAGDDVEDVKCAECAFPELWFTQTDLEILRRADAILANVSRWDRTDDRNCEEDDANRRWSLFCALRLASREVASRYVNRRAAVDEIRLTIIRTTGRADFEDYIRDFNNLPTTRYRDVKQVLQNAIAQVESSLNTS